MEQLWYKLSAQYLVSMLGQGYMEGIVFQSNKQIPYFNQVLELKSSHVGVKKCQTCLWK